MKFIEEINENQKVVLKVQSDSYDKFCPKNVYVHPDNGIQFNYKMKSEWYSKQTNNYVHFATIEIEKNNYIPGIAPYYNLVFLPQQIFHECTFDIFRDQKSN